MASKLESLARRFRRWVEDRLEEIVPGDLDAEDSSTHPGHVYHARTELKKRAVREHRGGPKFKGNPHLGSWKRYTTHLFDLILDGHGRSTAAMQVRDRLNFHWRFMSKTEQAEGVVFFHEAKQNFLEEKSARDLAETVSRRSRDLTRDLYAEVDTFMNPKSH